MANFRYNASSAFIVKPDTPLCDCVKAMRDRGYGAVLVSDPSTQRPYGIFTERDVIRWIDEIQNGGYWYKPVFLLMSKPIHTITLDEIHDAPRIMIEQKIRHLPVVHSDPDSHETITSMISMRDILKNIVHWQKKAAENAAQVPDAIHVGMLSKSSGMRNLLRKICAQHGNATIETFELDKPIPELANRLRQLHTFYFDIDHFDPAVWTALLKELNADSVHPEVTILYDPSLHKEIELEALAKIGLSGRFSAYMKPLNLFVLVNQLLAIHP